MIFQSLKSFQLEKSFVVENQKVVAETADTFFSIDFIQSFEFRKELIKKKKKRKIGLKEKYERVSHGVVSVFFLYLFWTRKWIKKKKKN